MKPPGKGNHRWSEFLLYRFKGYPTDGLAPNGNLIDDHGSLFGATMGGANGEEGIVFAISSAKSGNQSTEKILHTFHGREGGNPAGGLILDSNGNLLGTASSYGAHFAGTIFIVKADRQGKLDVLYSFAGPPDAAYPLGTLASDKAKNLYGSAQSGGSGQVCQGGCGAIFEVSP